MWEEGQMRRDRKSKEVGDGFDPDRFTPIHAFW